MRHTAFQFLVVAILFVFVAAWTKEGTLPTTCRVSADVHTDWKLSLDHEIFQIRDEILAKEGANVTFYGKGYWSTYRLNTC